MLGFIIGSLFDKTSLIICSLLNFAIYLSVMYCKINIIPKSVMPPYMYMVTR